MPRSRGAEEMWEGREQDVKGLMEICSFFLPIEIYSFYQEELHDLQMSISRSSIREMD